MFFKTKKQSGFTLVEALVGVAVFLVVSLAAYNAYVGLFKLINLNQYRVLALSLANERFEIARNMPYSDIGIIQGLPKGKIASTTILNRGGVNFTVKTIVRNIDLPFDGTIGGTPNDLSPADNKLIEISIDCGGCLGSAPIVLSGTVAPKNLETASTNGALFVRVFDSNGKPVKDATVHIVNVATTTTIVIDDITDSNGMLQLVDVPPGTNAYRISVTKNGYSTDRTYPIDGSGNPNPSKPDATVILQQVTQISFAIDVLSTLNISSVTPTCIAVPNIDFTFIGSKVIGPGVYKYSQSLSTNSNGNLVLNNLEWDNYTLNANDGSYDLIGLNPLNPVSLNPNATQNLQVIVAPKHVRSLLLTIKDSVNQLPVSDATVNVTGPDGFNQTLTTGRGYITQTDWMGGDGQTDYTDPTKYFSDDGKVDTATSSGQVVLKNVFGLYNANGSLESSTFDTGSQSNFYSLIWSPNDQPISVGSDSVRMQFASNATITPTTTWAFSGPDGASTTYYTNPNSSLSNVHNGDRYARYRLYLASLVNTSTPNVSDVSFTYTSNCVPPGQVIFTNLESGSYTVTVTKNGYTESSMTVNVSSNWQEQQVILAP